MIPKNCRDFGQDHATKQVIRAKWRFDLMPFRARPILRKQIGRHQRGDAALCRVCARRRQGIKRRASFVNDRLLLPRTTRWPRLALRRPRLQKLGCQDQASGYLAPRLLIKQVDQRLTLSGAGRPAAQRASWSVSPVRMRTACSSGVTKILPSPIWPVRAAAVMASIT